MRLPYMGRRLACALSLLVAAPLAAQQPAAPAGGDFHVGDRVLLTVDGEQQLSDTFTVVPGPALDLPTIGTISLAGVRHADLQSYLTQAIGRYVRDPSVHATAMIRLGVLGEVQHPGFYSLPAQSLMSDALMAAGGPTNKANLARAKIERDNRPAVAPDSLARALTGGLTLAELGLRSGDQIDVPAQADAERTAQIIGILVTIPVALVALIRVL